MTNQDLARVDSRADSVDSRTAPANQPARRFRTEEQLRSTLSMLCDLVWNGRPSRGVHVWSIPVDEERDFDCILCDAIDELIERRGAQETWNPDLTTAPRDQRIKLQLPPYVTGHLTTVVSVEPIAWAPDEETK